MELRFTHHAAKEGLTDTTILFATIWTALCATVLCLMWPALGLARKPRRTWSVRQCAWWASLAVAALLPVILAHKVALPTSIRNIDRAIADALAFGERHPILVPKKGPVERQAASAPLYNGTDASLTRWHRGISALMGWIETRTPVGEVAEVIEFKMTEEAERRVAPRGGVREARAVAVAAYFGIAAVLWVTESVHLAVMLLELNVLETALALKIKTLDDATSAAVAQIKDAQLRFAMLPLEADAIGLAQQQLCLQKFEILHQAWSESTRLGQTVRVPYLANHLTLHVSLILSVVAATTLRALEVLLGALFPGMPRYAIVRQLARFIAGRLRSIHAVVLDSPEAAAALQAPRNLLRSLSPSPVRRAGAPPPPRRPSRGLTAIREALHDSGREAPGCESPSSPWGLAAGPVEQVSAHNEPGSPGRTPARPHGGGARSQPSSGAAAEGATARPVALADGVASGSEPGRAGEPAKERDPAAGTPPASQATPEAAAAGAGAAQPQPLAGQAQQAGPAAHAAAEAVTDPPERQGQTPRDLLAEWRASAAERACDEIAAGARDAKHQPAAQPVPGSPPAKAASESAVSVGRNGGPVGLPAGPPGFDAQTLQRISGGSLGSLKSSIAGGSLGSDSGAGSLTRRLKKRVSFSEDNEVTLYLE